MHDEVSVELYTIEEASLFAQSFSCWNMIPTELENVAKQELAKLVSRVSLDGLVRIATKVTIVSATKASEA